MTKKFICNYLLATMMFACIIGGVTAVSAEEVMPLASSSSSGKITLKCGESKSWRSTTGSASDVGLSKITRVSCSSTLADATARVIVGDNTTYASTTSTKRTVEAQYNTMVTSHKHNFSAFYG